MVVVNGHSRKGVSLFIKLAQNRIPEARTILAGVRKQVNRWATEPFRINDSEGALWFNWGIVRILLEEAEKMLAEAEN